MLLLRSYSWWIRLWDAKLVRYSPDLLLWFGAQPQKSTVLDLHDLVWSLRVLQPEQNFLNHLVIALWLTAPFMQQMFLVAPEALWPSLNLHHICVWLSNLTDGLKQCIMCQLTKYHNTTKHSGYVSWLEPLRLHDIYATNQHVLPKYCKTFNSPL